MTEERIKITKSGDKEITISSLKLVPDDLNDINVKDLIHGLSKTLKKEELEDRDFCLVDGDACKIDIF